MPGLSQSLTDLLGRARDAVGSVLPILARPEAEHDHVAEKLGDLKWVDSEDESTASRQAEGRANRGDGLGETVFRARPRNPFGDDF